MVPQSLQLSLLSFKAGPAGGRLRRPSSAGNDTMSPGTGLTLHTEANQSSHKRIASDALGMLHWSTPGCQPAFA
jgi:hypothetical protein